MQADQNVMRECEPFRRELCLHVALGGLDGRDGRDDLPCVNRSWHLACLVSSTKFTIFMTMSAAVPSLGISVTEIAWTHAARP
jgi:hypothetical protein